MASALIDASALAALFGRNPIQTQKYDELLALGGMYANLYRLQFSTVAETTS